MMRSLFRPLLPLVGILALLPVTAFAAASHAASSQASHAGRPATAAPAGDATLLASLEKPAKTRSSGEFRSSRIPFSVEVGGASSPFSMMSAFVLPSQALEFTVTGGSGHFTATTTAGTLVGTGSNAWRWTAPGEPGNHPVRIRDTKSGEQSELRVFVMKPYDGGGSIGSHRIGHYARAGKDDDDKKQMPKGFIEVRESDLATPLTAHFRLGQFLCKDGGSWPKYVAVQTPLLVKLELLLDALDRQGVSSPVLHVMSGYRTPSYNAGIGNETTKSRHLYGDAADVFLDRDGDGRQDDLDGDGLSTVADSKQLYRIVEDVLDRDAPELVGGLSSYGPNSSHGPFLHVDTRGTRARW